jgi:uncharacterized membrane protein YhhN
VIGALSALALASGALHVASEYRGSAARFLWKPLTTSAILAIALVAPQPVSPAYRALVAAGLACSLAGDVFLMLPRDRFLPGLASFFVAHLCYIGAFAGTSGLHVSPAALTPFLAFGGGVYALLFPHLGRMRVPATLYVIAILAMGWLAAEQWLAQRTASSAAALAGAALFAVSDSALALDRFRRPFAAARAVVLGTYYPAQWLIALSVGALPG